MEVSAAPPAVAAPTAAPETEQQAAVREYRAGRPALLESYCRKRLEIDAGEPFAVASLSQVLVARNDYDGAIAVTLKAAQLAPEELTHRINLAHFYIQTKRYAEGSVHALKATQLDPASERVWINYASACYHQERFQDCVDASQRALNINPRNEMALNNMATAYKGQGRISEAVAAYNRALDINADNPITHTNLLLTLMYDASVPVQGIVAAAQRYAARFETPLLTKRKPYRNTPLPDRRLRVGFISPDFSSHAVMYFAEPVLARLPREQFEIYCYYTYPAGDYVTDRTRRLADAFRAVPWNDPAKTAEMIREDEIDILVDLAGHTAKNGLHAMAHKPAPVQATWLGYPGTTGLKSIDWRITDHVADPPGVEAQYSEGLIRLPGTFCVYRPHIRSALHRFDPQFDVAPAPCATNGFITFGSCNNIGKITPPTMAAWGRVLAAVPGAKLLIEGKDLKPDAATTAGLAAQFGEHGVDASRLILVPRDARQQYLTYHRIDIALDSFPLTGGTTTFDAMWMGVPVVSLLGRCFRERLSATILNGGGYKENICGSVDAYVARAVALASDPRALGALRTEMRPRMQASVLMDEARFVKLFAQALRGMWHKWCASQEPQGGIQPGAGVAGQDLLINVSGRRISLPAAVALLGRLSKAGDQPRAKVVAQAIADVVPEQPEAAAVLRQREAMP